MTASLAVTELQGRQHGEADSDDDTHDCVEKPGAAGDFARDGEQEEADADAEIPPAPVFGIESAHQTIVVY